VAVSDGCKNCYAARMQPRFNNPVRYAAQDLAKVELYLDQDALLQPLRWRKPRMIFPCSMTDLFGEWVPDEWIDKMFAVMARCPQHKFQLLTKRAKRMRDYLSAFQPDGEGWITPGGEDGYDSLCPVASKRWPLPNVWAGISAEDQARADERIPLLLETPAAVRWVSVEPMLGPVDLTTLPMEGGTFDALRGEWTIMGGGVGDVEYGPIVRHGLPRLDWVILGGESGPGARPMHPDWARSVRDQCAAAGVPFFFKQWGAWAPHKPVPGGDLGGDVRAGRATIVHPTGQSDVEVFEATGGRNTIPGSRFMKRVGKKAAGALLDGREHREFPRG
jgi:protein gp37